MIDRLFTAALTFCLLAGGTAAVGSAWLEHGTATAQPDAVQVVQLPAVEVVGKRAGGGLASVQPDATEPAARKVQ
jgi:hypothetical protein